MAERYDEQYRDRGQRRDNGDRGFMERAGEEVRSWFGGDDPDRRRQMDDPNRDRESVRDRWLGQNTEGRGQDYRGQDYSHGQDYPRGQDYRGQENRGQEGRGQGGSFRDDDRGFRSSTGNGGNGGRGVSEYGSRVGSNYDTGQSGSNYGSGGNAGYSSGGSYGSGYSSYGPAPNLYGPGGSQGLQGYGQGYGQGTGRSGGYGQGDRDSGAFGGRSRAEAESYRERGSFAGRGPKGYQRSDARISEDVCDRLAESPDVDASNIEVKVEQGEVTLSGSVAERGEKRRAEDLIENVSGVREVHNHLRVNRGQVAQASQNEGLGRTSVLGLADDTPTGVAGGGSTERPTNTTAGASATGTTGSSATGASGAGASTGIGGGSGSIGASGASNSADVPNPGITGGGPSGATDISKTSTAGGRR